MRLADPDVTIVAGFATHQDNLDYPVYTNPANFTGEADVVIDFSNPKALDHLLPFCVERCIPIVIATTGFSPEQLAQIDEAAKTIPVFRSANMSLGINVLLELVRRLPPFWWAPARTSRLWNATTTARWTLPAAPP